MGVWLCRRKEEEEAGGGGRTKKGKLIIQRSGCVMVIASGTRNQGRRKRSGAEGRGEVCDLREK